MYINDWDLDLGQGICGFTPKALHSKAQGRRGTRRTLGSHDDSCRKPQRGFTNKRNSSRQRSFVRHSRLFNPDGVIGEMKYSGVTQGGNAASLVFGRLWNETPSAYKTRCKTLQ